MMADDIRIVIAAHKEYRMPSDPMYLPLHVGAALSDKELGYIKDNTGDNISERNPSFCELTGLYWEWKNLDADYTGLVHYRRHLSMKKKGRDPFDNVLKYEEIRPLLYHCSVFLPKKRNYYIETLYSHYAHTHYADQLDLTRDIILDLYPEYKDSFDRVMKRTGGYMFNMMILRRDLLNDYCTWLFEILFELEKRYHKDDLDPFQSRFYGRVSEIIFNVWLDRQLETGRIRPDQIRELSFIYMEPVNWLRKGTSFLKAKFFHSRYDRSF
ncbi:MAG: DUF4422 domain-containing protein [Solobacterium sp.]|nr:DUF4422 domain-containing protein [Solobacterium sp.]